MIKNSKEKTFWNDFYSRNNDLINDNWLEKYKSLFVNLESHNVLEIGCGSGLLIPYYLQHNWKVTVIDFSENAINNIRKKYPTVDARVSDIKNGFDFPQNSFTLIVADLSLHYFFMEETLNILGYINSIMVDEAVLLVRVNSNNDINFGAGEGIEIEPGYFNFDGIKKRFFDEEMISDLFGSIFKLDFIQEMTTNRYNSKKYLREFVAKK